MSVLGAWLSGLYGWTLRPSNLLKSVALAIAIGCAIAWILAALPTSEFMAALAAAGLFWYAARRL